MEQVTIGQIVGVLTTIMVILGFVKAIVEAIKKTIFNKIQENAEEINNLKRTMEVIKTDVEAGKEERLILVNGVLACLKGLKEQGCNGPVTEGINKIEAYLMAKSHD